VPGAHLHLAFDDVCAGHITNVAIAKGWVLWCLPLRGKLLLESFAIKLLALGRIFGFVGEEK
jgi:hypothetical protein